MSETQRLFIGHFEHQLDAANRLVIPAKWRVGKAENFCFITRAPGNVAVLPRDELARIIQNIAAAPHLSASEKRKRTMIFATAFDQTCDAQGRITLDARLLKEAGLKDRVVLVGFAGRFEILSPEVWRQRKGEIDASRTSVMEGEGI